MATDATPLKVTTSAKDMVRYGAAIFQLTQGEFVEQAVAEYMLNHAAEIQRREGELMAMVETISHKPPLRAVGRSA